MRADITSFKKAEPEPEREYFLIDGYGGTYWQMYVLYVHMEVLEAAYQIYTRKVARRHFSLNSNALSLPSLLLPLLLPLLRMHNFFPYFRFRPPAHLHYQNAEIRG